MITTTMTWHPMLQDMLGIKINNKFVSVIKYNNAYKCITKDGMYPVKYKEAFEAYLLHQHKFVNSSARCCANEGLEIVFDFNHQRVLFTADPHIIILSDENEYLDDEICPQKFINHPSSKELITHWISDVNHRRRVKMDYEENAPAQIISLKRWRDKLFAVG
ncbi:MAG: hypothetical protein ACI9T7_000081 [Oleiphilaceae bacterium]|jgi:hypothetical protein